MQYRKLGNTDIDVSLIGLGTMTWGEQNSEAEAHAQLDMAMDHGVNLIDTAELYPIPPREHTQGATETMIGHWLAARGCRDRVVLATKVVGRAHDPKRPSYFRDGKPMLDRANIVKALDDSLRRLQTDYVDFYQLHWPDRRTNMFGQLGFEQLDDADTVPIAETLAVLDELVKAGKIRHIGLSNETPWGVHQFLREAERHNYPRIQGIQNPYNLLNRTYEIGLSEFSLREQVGLLAYSPLAFGMLTGKYENGAQPEGARLTLYNRFQRYNGAASRAATSAYVALARQHGLTPTQLAQAFVNTRPFVTSNLIGATSLTQLKENLDSVHVVLTEELQQGIADIHQQYPNPAP
ncbi:MULTISPECIES: NADP(H)-dependent aldo-keto reductase [Oceanimonas]|uniref:Protein tas n=1 Tax=Oceanimonas doudoroffii TaxID=84158 RepID=A0A233RFQ5_9GAMM|nr:MULTISPECIES: NADP(H)-dependent aldo-keto reductase [Oceanimonas]NHI01744.1 General stress protein 69 [Oceanimonas sp. MB9]OXY82231.1 NADP(H)-dependent aldo-keto reductase [Oceanimonas doudoroffii]